MQKCYCLKSECRFRPFRSAPFARQRSKSQTFGIQTFHSKQVRFRTESNIMLFVRKALQNVFQLGASNGIHQE